MTGTMYMTLLSSVFCSTTFDADSGQTKFLEDVYEQESRNIPGGYWGKADPPFTTSVSAQDVFISP